MDHRNSIIKVKKLLTPQEHSLLAAGERYNSLKSAKKKNQNSSSQLLFKCLVTNSEIGK